MLDKRKAGWQYCASVCLIAGTLLQVCSARSLSPQGDSQAAARLAGNIAAAHASCRGLATATLIADELPLSFGSQPVTCCFLPWIQLQDLEDQGSLVEGASTNSSQELADLLQDVLSAASSPAALTPLTYLQAEDGESKQSGISCRFPRGAAADATPVLLTSDPSDSAANELILVVPRMRMARTVLSSLRPVLGPSAGGTTVFVRGEGLQAPMTCSFSNSSTAVNVTATVLNSSVAVCTSPAWTVDLKRASEAVSLSATSGGCMIESPFEFYTEPQVTGVHPLRGPRYGSFLLQVNLGASLDDLAMVERDGILPVIRIAGADVNGSDLLLPANLTEDRCSLTTETPIERTPLAAGDHRVHVSLNGQQYADQQPLQAGILTVEGPAVFMSQPYYWYSAGSVVVGMSARLQGMSTLPVAANLSVSQRSLSGDATVDEAPAMGLSLDRTQLQWEAGRSELRNFTLTIGGDASLMERGGVLVTIEGAENADVADHNDTSIVSALDPGQLTVGFGVVPNQVVYRGENASIPIEIKNAALRLPAAIEYSIFNLNGGGEPTYIPSDLMVGYLEWDLQLGDVMYLDLPIDWDDVSYQTEDHLMIKLKAAWNAGVPDAQNDVGLHVFGVEREQCPPGTFRLGANPSPPPSVFKQSPRGGPTDGWLESILVYGGDEWSLDLSSQFSPDVPEYGVIVPANFANATLCVQPNQASAAVTLVDSSGQVLGDAARDVVAATKQYSSAAGRRLQGDSVAVLVPGPVGSPSGVKALGTKERKNATACASHSWLLPLLAGQNAFTIHVGSMQMPPALPPFALPRTSLDSKSQPAARNGTAASAPASPGNGVYTLSVVRLADAAHAEVSEVNVTALDAVFSVCSRNPEAVGPETEWARAVPPCLPDSVMRLNVSSDTEWLSLHLRLRYPGVQGLRVEVAGQVLSQGGNVGADQVADTTAVNTVRDNTDFLPVAVVVGLQPGVTVEVPIVVVAEDSVTSLRYFLDITRADIPENETSSLAGLLAGGSAASPADGDDTPSTLLALAGMDRSSTAPPPPQLLPGETHQDWPTPPSRQPWCNVCPAGWATTEIDESHCSMCTPGTFAQSPQSPACLQCPKGTYADSWGSTHCNHCIIGTFSTQEGSRLCFMCPENMTNLEDGSDACPVPVMPGTNLTMRYAVIVSFGVYLNGTSLDEIAAKVGVNASSRNILEQLIRSDTAAAFNITSRDVNVTGISQITRRVLLVNVTATLGVDLPTNSSQTDIEAELAVKNLSADDAIDMLASQPDRFLGRTTKALEVTAEPGNTPPTRVESHPPGVGGGDLLPWYAILLLCVAAALLLAVAARVWRKRSRRLYNSVVSKLWPFRAYRLQDSAPSDAPEGGEGLASSRIAGPGLTARGRTVHVPEKAPMFAGAHSDAPGLS